MPRPILDLPDVDAGAVYLTTGALADYLHYRGTHRVLSARRFIARHQLRKFYRSAHCVLVKRADVDRALEGLSQRIA